MATPKKSPPSVKKSISKKSVPVKKASSKNSPKKTAPAKKKPAVKAAGIKAASAKQKTKKTPVKNDPVKKVSAQKKPIPSKADTKPVAAGKAAHADSKPAKSQKPASKSEPLKSTDKPARAEKSIAKPAKTAAPSTAAEKKSDAKAGNKRDALRQGIIDRKKALKPIAFTLEEATEIAKTVLKTNGDTGNATAAKAAPTPAKPDLNKLAKAIAPSHVKAASLADILGFNPKKAQKPTLFADPETIPEKYRRYYKLLLDLRTSLTAGLSLHTEETLRRSTKDDAGDLSSYGQHMADAGTDTFDRDFALSMVANEQDALTEIDAAIKRIHAGTYGICEITQKPIAKERLIAVPFTRYSAEAQKDLERNRMRVRTAAGLFGEGGDDSGRGDESSGGGDEE